MTARVLIDKAGRAVLEIRPGSFNMTNTVGLQVNIKDQSGKKGTSIVRGDAVNLYSPNINLVAAGIEVHRPSPSNTVLTLGGPTIVAVQTGVPSQYTVKVIRINAGVSAGLT
jgi:hypothetical protein